MSAKDVRVWDDSRWGCPSVEWPWPTDVPAPFDDPGCVEREWGCDDEVVTIVSNPQPWGGQWWVYVREVGSQCPRESTLSDLRPVKPERCAHRGHSDRRTQGERRQGERRASTDDYMKRGRRKVPQPDYTTHDRRKNEGRRQAPSYSDRRSGKDRRHE